MHVIPCELRKSNLTSRWRQHLTTALSVGKRQPLPLSNSRLLKGPHRGRTCNRAESWITVQKNAWGTLYIQWKRVRFSILALMSGACRAALGTFSSQGYIKRIPDRYLQVKVFIYEGPVGHSGACQNNATSPAQIYQFRCIKEPSEGARR